MTTPHTHTVRHTTSPVDSLCDAIVAVHGKLPQQHLALVPIDSGKPSADHIGLFTLPEPGQADSFEAAAHWLSIDIALWCQDLGQTGASRVAIVAFTEMNSGSIRSLLMGSCLPAVGFGVTIEILGWVSQGLWWDAADASHPRALTSSQGAITPPTDDVGATPGQMPSPNDDELTGSDWSRRMHAWLRADAVMFGELVAESPSERQECEDAIVRFLTDPGASLPPPAAGGQWVVALGDRRVREPVLWRLSHGSGHGPAIGQIRRAINLLRVSPRNSSPALGSVLAVVAWQSGHPGLARAIAGHAVGCDPRNVLSNLVIKALDRGLPAAVWTEAIRSVDIGDLRAGRPPAMSRE